jgi:hypothetical protein
VVSTDGLLGKDDRILLQKLSALLAAKSGRTAPCSKFADRCQCLEGIRALWCGLVVGVNDLKVLAEPSLRESSHLLFALPSDLHLFSRAATSKSD